MQVKPSTWALLLALAPLAGCAGSATSIAGCPAIPAVVVEAPGKPPMSYGPQVYQPAHWDWTGSSFVLIPGTWMAPPPGASHYMEAYWNVTPQGACAWQPAHWM